MAYAILEDPDTATHSSIATLAAAVGAEPVVAELADALGVAISNCAWPSRWYRAFAT